MAFGGGVQTVAMALMCIDGHLPMPDCAIFSDPGWEVEGTYEYLSWFIPYIEERGLKCYVVQKGNIRKDALSKEKSFASMPLFTKKDTGLAYGMLRRQCTNEYKIQPVYNKIRELKGLKKYQRTEEKTKLWLGISTDEIQRAGKINPVKWLENYYPFIEYGISRQDCLSYINKLNLPIPPKSACIGCPYHSDTFWTHLKKKAPEEFEDAVSFDKDVRKTRVAIENPVYLHRSCRPLDEIDFTSQGDLFEMECDGYCGL
jgi:hypothetical protein